MKFKIGIKATCRKGPYAYDACFEREYYSKDKLNSKLYSSYEEKITYL